jgi:hypothetical protein
MAEITTLACGFGAAGPASAAGSAFGTTKVGSHGRQRDPGSAIFLSSRLSSSRPPRLGRPSEPSLRRWLRRLDPRPLTRKLPPETKSGEIRRRNLAATMTWRSQ